MARDFVRASSQYLSTNTVPITIEPITIAAWFWPDDGGTFQTIVSLVDKDDPIDTANRVFAMYHPGTAADPNGGMRAQKNGPEGSFYAASSVSVVTVGQWNHGCAVFASTSSRKIYVNGGNSGTNTTSVSHTGAPDHLSVGRRGQSAGDLYFDGRIAEVAIWNVALTDSQVVTLAQGYSPFAFPSGLVFYSPILGAESPEPELLLSNDLTVTGATTGAHPPITDFQTRSQFLDYDY